MCRTPRNVRLATVSSRRRRRVVAASCRRRRRRIYANDDIEFGRRLASTRIDCSEQIDLLTGHTVCAVCCRHVTNLIVRSPVFTVKAN